MQAAEIFEMQKAKLKKRPDADNETRLERVFGKLFPEFSRIGPRLARILNEFDPSTPRSTFTKGRKLLDSYLKVNSVRGRFFVRLLKVGLKSEEFEDYFKTQLDEFIKTAKTEAARDPRYALLLKLMHEADQVVPFASYIVVHRHADPEKSFLKQMDPLPDLESARNYSGERRFNHAKEAFRRTVEHLYDPYIRTLVYLSYTRNQKPAADFSNVDSIPLGVALDHLNTRLSDYPDLFDTRAAWFRNSITHEILEYDLTSDSLVLKDNSKSATITTNDLLDLTESLYQLSAKTVVFISQLYLFREIFRNTGLFDLCVKYIPRMAVETDPLKFQSIENEFGKHLEKIFGSKKIVT